MRSQRLFGLEFTTDATAQDVARWLMTQPAGVDQSWHLVVTPNVDHLVRYRAHAPERCVAEAAELVLPDGTPVVWASRILGRPLDGRITGSDLFAALWPQICAQRSPVVVLSSGEDVAAQLRSEHPGGRYVVAGDIDLDDDPTVQNLVNQLMTQIVDIGAQFVVLGLSMPKHHRIAAELAALPAPTSGPFVLLLGAAADFYTGTSSRAPSWMRRLGIEWLYRLGSDPRRLARRYLVDDIAFFPMVWREWRQQRRTTHRRLLSRQA